MKKIIYLVCVTLFVTNSACKKSEASAPKPVTVTTANSSGQSKEPVEIYFRNGQRVDESTIDKTAPPTNGEEWVTVVKEDTLFHYFFTSWTNLVSWANTVNDGDKLIAHLERFDELSTYAEENGEIEFFEDNGVLSESFEEYLLSGDYNYKYTPQSKGAKTAALGQFMKGYSSYGPSLPIITFPSVGSGFDNQISYHQAIGAGWVSIFDKTFWRNRLKTFWFIAYTSQTYYGWYYDDKTTSVSLSF